MPNDEDIKNEIIIDDNYSLESAIEPPPKRNVVN